VVLAIVAAGSAALFVLKMAARPPFCEVTIVSLTVNPSLQGRLEYTYRASVGVTVTEEEVVDGAVHVVAAKHSTGLPFMTQMGERAMEFLHDPSRPGPLSPEEFKKTILVKEGQKYVVKVGRPLLLYRITASSGAISEGRVSIHAGNVVP
jgi:hypothetical protein